MSSTWDTLQIARDARLCGLASQYEALLAEVAPDFEYVRRSKQRTLPKFWFDAGDPYEDDEDYEPESRAEQRASWRESLRYEMSRDWLAWIDRLKTANFDAILREHYSDSRISHFASMDNPMMRMLRRSSGSDTVEARLTSYANLVSPAWYGTFLIPEDK